jgi:hypothetical protein
MEGDQTADVHGLEFCVAPGGRRCPLERQDRRAGPRHRLVPDRRISSSFRPTPATSHPQHLRLRCVSVGRPTGTDQTGFSPGRGPRCRTPSCRGTRTARAGEVRIRATSGPVMSPRIENAQFAGVGGRVVDDGERSRQSSSTPGVRLSGPPPARRHLDRARTRGLRGRAGLDVDLDDRAVQVGTLRCGPRRCSRSGAAGARRSGW